MSNPTLYRVVINGEDVSTYIYSIPEIVIPKNQSIKSGVLKIKATASTVITFSELIGKTITIQRGFSASTERYILRGEIISYKNLKSVYEITFADKLYVAQRLEYDYTFDKNIDTEAGVGSEIVKTLLTHCGLSYEVTSTGTSDELLLNTYPINGKIINTLRDLCKIYFYRIFYNDDEDKVYFIPNGGTSTSTILTTGIEIKNRPAWLVSGDTIINNATIIGGEQLDWNYQTFSGDDSTTTFTLDAVPVDTDIFVGTTKLLRGVNSSDPKDFYTIDHSKEIIFTTAPTTGSDNIHIYYSYNVPIKVTSKDYDSIDNYNQRDNTIVNEKLTNTDDAELRATKYVEQANEPLTSAPLIVLKNNDLMVGQTITIVDDINSITTDVYVESIKYKYPYTGDEVDVGRLIVSPLETMQNIIENIRRLQRQLASSTDVNVSLLQFLKSIEISGYVEVSSASMDANTLYWNSDTQGEWDNFNWGTDTEETYTVDSTTYINDEVIL